MDVLTIFELIDIDLSMIGNFELLFKIYLDENDKNFGSFVRQ